MRSQCALYVDAGYLLAAATRVTGTSLRGGIQADHERLIEALVAHATAASELPLLRVHWYDAARHGVPDRTQEEIGLLPRVKLRLGRIGFDGEQKGVDLRIGLDMVAHARNAVVDVIYLVSGDDDLTEAVEEAQAHGVQVTVLAVPTTRGTPHSVSRHLQAAADELHVLDAAALDTAIAPRTAPPSVPAPTPDTEPPRPPVPSPAVLANRVPVTPPPRSAPSPAAGQLERADATLVYSSSSGTEATITPDSWMTEDLAEHFEQVANRVLQTWLSSATAEQREALRASRPSIPREIDRALLRDLSDRLGVYDMSDTIRHQLRARFWQKVDDNHVA